MTYQNYKHYKLPITINPLDYGKLILKIDELNLFILQITKTNIVIITQDGLINHIKLYKEGDFKFEYSDYKLSNKSFTRTIDSIKYTFKDNKLVQSIVLALIVVFISLNHDWTFSGAEISLAAFKFPFKNMSFRIFEEVMTRKFIEKYFDIFWNQVSDQLKTGYHIFILVKVRYSDKTFATVSKIIRIDRNNKDNFINQLMNQLELRGEYYQSYPISGLIFSYGFKKGLISDPISSEEIKLMKYKENKIPISLNPNDYGKSIEEITLDTYKIYILQDPEGRIIKFKEFDKENIITFIKNQIEILTFRDIKLSSNSFIREINKRKIYYSDGTQNLTTQELLAPFITKIKKDKIELNNFITLDIETYGESELIPYLISFYDGVQTYSFYLSDYNSIELMMEACFKKLFVRKYNKYNVYIHNLTKFDVIFLLKYLVNHVYINPIIHRARIIQLQISYGQDLQYQMNFKDSYLILLASLEKLSSGFNVENKKSIFPHKFVTENNLNYIGEAPGIENFYKISTDVYNNYTNSFLKLWNLKSEAIKYCELDVISLYQILLKFNSLIFSQFNKNIHRYPTLPSLAFGIFRSNFMDEENIPKLTGNIESDIRQGYTGGSTDMFIPYGTNIKCYDVNALYPSVMLNRDMPIGEPIKFEGDITKIDDKPFGFFYVKVNCPENIMHPIIQIHLKTHQGIKTVSPVGSWSMWIFSEEMYNAQNYGYTFEILRGYKFQRGIVFKSYVELLYGLRIQYNKDNPLNYISKILLNSLYGRFGMSEINIEYNILSKEDLNNLPLDKKETILETVALGDKVLVSFNIESINEFESDISVSIAAAITAYARIHMSQFKNNPNIRLYYTDTDSIYTDSDLNSSFIDNKILGKLKLEYICKEAIFLSPKVYYLETVDGKIIIKVKGLKSEVELTKMDFKNLLIKDFSITKSQSKWFRDLTESKITILEQLYTLKVTDNKRKLIYDKNNKLIETRSYLIKENKIIH